MSAAKTARSMRSRSRPGSCEQCSWGTFRPWARSRNVSRRIHCCPDDANDISWGARRSLLCFRDMTAPRKRRSRLGLPDRHALYEAAVQSVDYDLDHVERLFRRLRGRPARVLREDFCGTAGLACAWVLRDPAHVAYGVDLDPVPLAWAR